MGLNEKGQLLTFGLSHQDHKSIELSGIMDPLNVTAADDNGMKPVSFAWIDPS
jgi:hypothetical protein